jgi:EAL domain-containing protein (putative c-di-GMP-specific phosphodiesterase class I)
LYRAKQRGKGIVCVYDPSFEFESDERRQLDSDLSSAILLRQFELHYQPIIQLQSERQIGVEALMRWHHPSKGQISPGLFIPAMEMSGMIRPAGRWVIETAIENATQFPDDMLVSINLSASQLNDPGLVACFSRALNKYQVDPSRIEVELTESVIMDQSPQSLGVLESIRKLGIKFALDDFGTGYSSLSMLTVFRFDRIKIDRSFVRNLNDHINVLLLTQIIDLAQKMGAHVTVEGIETEEQARFIRKFQGVDVQGYLYGRPTPIESALISSAKNKADHSNVVKMAGNYDARLMV